MEWIYIKLCVELILASTIAKKFEDCRSLRQIVYTFHKSDDAQKLGIILGSFIVGSGIVDLGRSITNVIFTIIS